MNETVTHAEAVTNAPAALKATAVASGPGVVNENARRMGTGRMEKFTPDQLAVGGGSEAVGVAADRVRAEFLGCIGLEDLLTPHARV
ncbi:hypothetical protein [Streptomyces sp. NPDC048560]|uniref:hypothetical protein n=1 Tax=Streptomyces sp. NPDC048560 TaxID=3155488 RepID=UPI0034222E92